MIELFDGDKKEAGRKSSKGNQLKWEKDGIWYKADYTGYEGLAEYVVSHLLMKSSLKENEYVVYEQEEISYNNRIYMGVLSRDFLKSGEQLLTLERLFLSTYGVGLNKLIYGITDLEKRFKMLADKTEQITGITDFGIYMSKVLTIDALFLNEDRHSHNIAVIMENNGKYRLCPIFDQGASLLSDTAMDYPINGDIYKLMSNVRSKTFCDDFDTQLEIAEQMYGTNLTFNFSKKDVDNILGEVTGYEKAVTDRVRLVIYEQMRKYPYLFRKG